MHRFTSLSSLQNLTTGPIWLVMGTREQCGGNEECNHPPTELNLTTGPIWLVVVAGGVGGWAREAGRGRSAPKSAPVPSTELPYKLNNWEAGEGCTRCGGLKNLWSGGWVDLG